MLSGDAVAQVASSIRMVSSLDELEVIHDPAVNICIVSRALPEAWSRALASLTETALERAHEVRPDTDVRAAFADLATEPRRALEEDVPRLLEAFLAVSGRRAGFVQLFRQCSDACRKFHVDYVSLRMLVTYSGPGTEVVDSAHARRRFVGDHSLSVEDANRLIVPDDRFIVRVRPGDAVLLKGEGYHRNVGRGAIHRSPPIESSGAQRLVLKIDLPGCGC